MRIKETGKGTSPVTVEQMEANLRLPSGFDTALITRLIASATDYVEKITNVAVRTRTVSAAYGGGQSIYDLKYLANAVTSVKVDGESYVVDDDYKVYNTAQPCYVKFTNRIDQESIVEIEYTVTATTNNEAINEVIIAYATAMYNQPEGLGELDMRRINNRLTSLAQ